MFKVYLFGWAMGFATVPLVRYTVLKSEIKRYKEYWRSERDAVNALKQERLAILRSLSPKCYNKNDFLKKILYVNTR